MEKHLMLAYVLAALCAPSASAQKTYQLPAGSTKLRMMHISDVHYHPAEQNCEAVPASMLKYNCTHKNSTQFLKSVMTAESPDMIVHTGDIIDGSPTVPSPQDAMKDIYGLSIDAGLPWAASLGNHDEENTMLRPDIVDFITKLEGGCLTEVGTVSGSPGNFYVDVLGSQKRPVARLVFFDSRAVHVHVMINDAQVAWFKNLTASLPKVPVLAFYHIPLQEYKDAVNKSTPISGAMNEPVCADGPNPNIFPALKAGGVVAGFCGHDHTNDFCVHWDGIELCYEGSPGFTAYGNPNLPYMRRSRITELQFNADGTSLASVRSWKRVDAGGAVAGPKVDDEELWSASGSPDRSGRKPVPEATCAALRNAPPQYSKRFPKPQAIFSV